MVNIQSSIKTTVSWLARIREGRLCRRVILLLENKIYEITRIRCLGPPDMSGT